MRALVIAPQPFFTPRGTPLSVYYRTLVLAELGATVDLLTYGEGEEVRIDGVRVVRIPRFAWLGSVPVGPSLLKAFLDLWLFGRASAMLLRRRYDLLWAHEEAVFFCSLVAPVLGSRMVYDMHSSLPAQLESFEFTRSRALIGLFERLERRALRRADAVVTISPALAAYARERMPDPARHELIENSLFEPVRLARETRDAEDASLNPLPRDATVVAYAGTLEPYQGIELLLEAFRCASQRAPELYLLVIGGRPEQADRYRRLARELGLESRSRFLGTLPQAATRRLLEQAAVLVSPRVRGTNTPLKLYELLASGKPLVLTRVPSHTQVVDDQVAFLADPEPESFAAALLEALLPNEHSRQVVAAAQQLYQKRYSRKAYEEKMRRVLEGLH